MKSSDHRQAAIANPDRNLSDDVAEFNNKFASYMLDYERMVRFAKITAADRLKESPQDRTKRIKEATLIFKRFAVGSTDIGILFRIKFRIYRTLEYRSMTYGTIHSLKDASETEYLNRFFGKNYHDQLRDRIRTGSTDPLVLFNFGALNFFWFLSNVGKQSISGETILEKRSMVRGHLMLAWLFAENSPQFRKEVESLFQQANTVMGHTISQPFRLGESVTQEEEGGAIYNILNEYPTLRRAAIMTKLKRTQDALASANPQQQMSSSILQISDLLSAMLQSQQLSEDQKPSSRVD